MYVRSSVLAVLRWSVAAALAGVSLGASAQDAAYQAFRDQVTGTTKHTVTFGSGGTPLVTTGVPGPTAVGNMNFAHDANGLPYASGTATVPSPIPGKSLPVTVKQPFPAAAVGKALAGFAFKAVGALSTGVAIYDLMKEMSVILRQDINGNNEAIQQIQGTASEYSLPTAQSGTQGATGWWGSKEQACYVEAWSYASAGYGSAAGAQNSTGNTTVNKPGGGTRTYYGQTPAGGTDGTKCRIYYNDSSNPAVNNIITDSLIYLRGSPTYSEKKLTEQELSDLIASHSGWPTSSAVDRAMADAAKALGANPPPYPMPDPVQTVVPSTTVSDDNGLSVLDYDGTLVTTKTGCNLFALPSGTVEWRCTQTETKTTPATTNPDGTTKPGTTTTKTTTGVTPTPLPTSTTPASSTPSGTTTAPVDQCAKYPDTIGCSTYGTPTAGPDIPHATSTISISPIDFAGSANCPSPIAFTVPVINKSFAFEYTTLCDKLASIGTLLLALSGLLAAYIFADGFRA